MASTPPLDRSGWINPRRPLTATMSMNGELAGGGRSPVRPLSGVVGGGSSNPSPSLANPRSDTYHPRYGRIRGSCPPTTMTNGSGGLAGGGLDPFSLPIHPYNHETDPYWLSGGLKLWWGYEDDGSSDETDFVEEEESDEAPVAAAESNMDESEIQCSPNFFPWPMEGETWEAAVMQAEQEMKEEGFSWLQTDDDGPKRL